MWMRYVSKSTLIEDIGETKKEVIPKNRANNNIKRVFIIVFI